MLPNLELGWIILLDCNMKLKLIAWSFVLVFHIVCALSSANYAHSFPLHLLNHLHFLSTTSNYSDAIFQTFDSMPSSNNQSWNFINLFYNFMQFFFTTFNLDLLQANFTQKPLKSFLHISNLKCIIYQIIPHFPTSASTKMNDPITNS